MNHLVSVLSLLVLVFTFSGCKKSDSETTSGKATAKIHRLKADEFYKMSIDTPGIYLDVRTQAEFNQSKIPNAILVDIYLADFESKIQSLPRDQAVYVYCTVGARSMQAARILQKNGFEKIYNLEGGIMDWARNRYPITR